MARLQVAMMSVLRTRETTNEIEHLQCDLQQLQVFLFCNYNCKCSFSDNTTERQRKAMNRGEG